ncbi:MAG: hypothetical protein NVS9B10_00180 [Nevskia sp.]
MSKRCLLALVAASVMALPARADTYGRLEHVRVMGAASIEVTARLDGAGAASSLHAVDVKYFQRDSDTWVRFTIDNGSVLPGSRVTLERRIVKDVKLRQKGGGVEHRPLVEVELCVGDRSFKSMLSVSDRTGYTAPLRLGSEDLAQLGPVDDARQYTHEPSCKPAETPPPAADKAQSGGRGTPAAAIESPTRGTAGDGAFHCDGRQRCSQMTSCAEAKYFLSHCPTVKMDGDGDGIPCEDQFCGH